MNEFGSPLVLYVSDTSLIYTSESTATQLQLKGVVIRAWTVKY